MKINIFLLVLTVGFFYTANVRGAIIFEDNFDKHADWKLTQDIFGSSNPITCDTGCNVPTGWDFF